LIKRIVIAIIFLAALGGAGLVYENARSAAQPKEVAPRAPQAVPVIATAALRKAVPLRLGAIGTVQPVATVVVKSRIDGQIAKVPIRDGQEVKAGDTLFVLDSRAIEAQARQAEAQLARDRAQLSNARREAERQAQLVSKNFTAAATYDTAQTTAATMEATVRADEAALDNMKVQITYCTITTPIDGRVGAVLLRAGNNVKANDTITLATVNQMHPIYVAFSVPQRELPAIREAMAARDLEVTAQAPGDNVPVETGKLAFIDNTVDATTGTIILKGVFDNTRDRLWPGQFVNVSLTLGIEPNALVIPAQAVQVGQTGSYVYVVKADKTVEPREVTVARSLGGESIISKGLDEGEQVVVDGQLRLTKGTLVEPRPAAAPAGGATS
jgi:membrane fusion protein, multidrug efflux system